MECRRRWVWWSWRLKERRKENANIPPWLITICLLVPNDRPTGRPSNDATQQLVFQPVLIPFGSWLYIYLHSHSGNPSWSLIITITILRLAYILSFPQETTDIYLTLVDLSLVCIRFIQKLQCVCIGIFFFCGGSFGVPIVGIQKASSSRFFYLFHVQTHGHAGVGYYFPWEQTNIL